MKNNKNNLFTFLIKFIVLILFFLFSLSFYYYLMKNRFNQYDVMLNKALDLIDKQNFLEALSIFEQTYLKGYRTFTILKNCIYAYQMTNQMNKMYIFIRRASIDNGFNPIFTKYINSILAEDYRWLTKINFIDYLNKFILFIILFISIILAIIFYFTINDKKRLLVFYLILIFINLFFISLFFIKISYYLHRDEAISINSTDIYNFPIKDLQPSFTIKEYIKLKIIKYYGDFVLIKLPDGKEGWILKKDILKVLDDK